MADSNWTPILIEFSTVGKIKLKYPRPGAHIKVGEGILLKGFCVGLWINGITVLSSVLRSGLFLLWTC